MFQNLRIKTKLVLCFLFIAIFSVLFTGVFSKYTAQEHLQRQVVRNLALIAENTNSQLADFFTKIKNRCIDFSSDRIIKNFVTQHKTAKHIALVTEMNRYLREEKMSLDTSIYGISIIDTSGQVIASTADSEIGKDESTNEMYVQAVILGQGKAIIGDASISDHFLYSLPSIASSTPIIDRQSGEILGVLIIYIDLNELNDITSGRQLLRSGVTSEERMSNQTLEILLVNSVNRLITQTKFTSDGVLQKTINVEPVFQCKERQEGLNSIYVNYRGIPVVGSSICLKNGWVLLAEIEQSEAFQGVTAIQKRVEVSMGLIILLAIIMSYVLAKKINGPINNLSSIIKKISAGDLDQKINIHTRDEIGQLAQTFSEMVENLKSNINTLAHQKKKIEREKARSEAILSSIGDGVFVVDMNKRILLMNKIAEELSGYSFEEAEHKSYHDIFNFIAEENRNNVALSLVEKVLQTGEIQTMHDHTILIRKNGSKLPVSDSAAPIKENDGSLFGCIVVFRDVRKERELEEAKDNFLSIAAHQLRTPLGSMKWNLEMLLGGDIGPLPDQVKNTVQQIFLSNKHMLTLVADLLNVSRIDQHRITDKLELVNVVTTINEVLSEVHNIAMARNITLKVDEKEGATGKIYVDQKRLRDVIENIVSNSLKYTHNGGRVTVTLESAEDKLKIIIADNGMGIPAKDQQKIFEKFFRADNAIKSETEGSGLGLFVVKSYIERWGGKVWFESEENKGTTFFVEIPRIKQPKEIIIHSS